MKLIGYLKIKDDADFPANAPYQSYQLQGKIFPMLENGGFEGILIRIPYANNLHARMVAANIETMFLCDEANGILLPPDISEIEKTHYCARVHDLPQPYDAYKPYIIADSIAAGKFTDACLFGETNVRQ